MERRWQRTVDRLQRQLGELTRKNRELQEEVKRANDQAQQVQFGPAWQHESQQRTASASSARGRRPTSASGASAVRSAKAPTTFARGQPATSAPVTPATSDVASWQAKALAPPQRGGGDVASNKARPGQVNGTSSDPSAAGRRASAIASADLSGSACDDALRPSLSRKSGSHAVSNDRYGRAVGSNGGYCKDSDIQEVRTTDGRTERVFKDGRREVEFSNGLKKIIHVDGRTSVMFQNGDRKEIHPSGVVVYEYYATGAKQTTLTDSSEIYEFADGQYERHSCDGSKEIRFPNGTSKRIFPDGSEEVTFADGTVRRSPPSG